jgi:hypothetical protein
LHRLGKGNDARTVARLDIGRRIEIGEMGLPAADTINGLFVLAILRTMERPIAASRCSFTGRKRAYMTGAFSTGGMMNKRGAFPGRARSVCATASDQAHRSRVPTSMRRTAVFIEDYKLELRFFAIQLFCNTDAESAPGRKAQELIVLSGTAQYDVKHISYL